MAIGREGDDGSGIVTGGLRGQAASTQCDGVVGILRSPEILSFAAASGRVSLRETMAAILGGQSGEIWESGKGGRADAMLRRKFRRC